LGPESSYSAAQLACDSLRTTQRGQIPQRATPMRPSEADPVVPIVMLSSRRRGQTVSLFPVQSFHAKPLLRAPLPILLSPSRLPLMPLCRATIAIFSLKLCLILKPMHHEDLPRGDKSSFASTSATAPCQCWAPSTVLWSNRHLLKFLWSALKLPIPLDTAADHRTAPCPSFPASQILPPWSSLLR
jgi:hypothetical protein